jgi:hypothetical protein
MIKFRGKEVSKDDLLGLGLRPDEIELAWGYYMANPADLEINSAFELHSLFKGFYRRAIGLSMNPDAFGKIQKIVSVFVNKPQLARTILNFAKVKLPPNPTEEDVNAFIQEFVFPVLRGLDDEADDSS